MPSGRDADKAVVEFLDKPETRAWTDKGCFYFGRGTFAGKETLLFAVCNHIEKYDELFKEVSEIISRFRGKPAEGNDREELATITRQKLDNLLNNPNIAHNRNTHSWHVH